MITTPFLAWATVAGFSKTLFQSAIRARAPFACSFGQSVLTNLSRTRCTEGKRHAPLVSAGNHALVTPVIVTRLISLQYYT